MLRPSATEAGGDPAAIAQLSRIDLNLLVHLQVLLEERSVTRAAARVGLTQPAMSHSLNRCRRLIGDDLLIKTGSVLEPTERGRALLGPLSQLLREIITDVLNCPAFVPQTSTRRFRLSATSTTTVVVLPRLLRHLAGSAPGVSFQVVASPEVGDDLAGNPDIDLVFLPNGLTTPLPRERLYNDRWVAVVSRDLDIPGGITIDHLRTLPHVLYESGGFRIPPYSVMDALGIEYSVRARSHDFLTMPFLVVGSDAIAVVQQRIARQLEATGLLQVFQLPVEIPELSIDMVWNPRLAQDPAKAWLREQLLIAIRRDLRSFPARTR